MKRDLLKRGGLKMSDKCKKDYEMFMIFTTGYSDMKEWDKLTEEEKTKMRKRFVDVKSDL